MLIVQTSDFVSRLSAMFPGFNRPYMWCSNSIGVLDYSFLSSRWSVYWYKYVTSRNLKYIPGSGMCEHFAQAACFESNYGVIQGYGDVRSSMVEARITIPSTYLLNGIPDGSHATCIVGMVEKPGDTDYSFWFWEPQYKVFNKSYMTRGEDAARNGVEIIDVIL